MAIPIAKQWLEIRQMDNDITRIWEPHLDPLICSNIWYIPGSNKNMVVDSGVGIVSLREALKDLFENPIIAVATHTHYDHVGGLHEFEERVVHVNEEEDLLNPNEFASLYAEDMGEDIVQKLREAGYQVPEILLTALPYESYDPKGYRVIPTPATMIVEEGDVIDLGNRCFEVLHLPGHSPGSIGLLEASTGVLFCGDVIYEDNYPLLDDLPGCSVTQYIKTMKRLRELPVTVVHSGHYESFGRARLVELADGYLRGK
jgi:glyoxylase-like metal-dependent hydrolase (beta-lactamase superfamily II)